MNLMTSIKLAIMQMSNSYDKLGTDINLYIQQQKNLGVTPISIREQLLKDLKNRDGIFREVFSAIKNERFGDYNVIAEVSSNEFVKNDSLKYEWYLDPDVREHCQDCINRSNKGEKLYSYWEEIGLPATGHTECGEYCKCTLVPNV